MDYEEEFENKYTLDYLTRAVAESFTTTLKRNLKELNMSRKQMEAEEFKKHELRTALKEAAYGNKQAKTTVINYIKNLLTQGTSKIYLSKETVDYVIHFGAPDSLKSREKFDIVLYIFEKQHKEKGLVEMINQYDLNKPIYREDGSFYYDISSDKITAILKDVAERYPLDYYDKINIIARRIFADYKGFGAADLLFDTTVDEIDCGVSGIPKDSYDIKQSDVRKAEFSYESLWIMVGGINIKMSCLSFGTQDELIRVCENIYKNNPPRALSKRSGYVVSTMKDGSRIVVCRPPFCESWCFFARKFDSAPSIDPKILLSDEGNQIPITLMKWFIKGYRTTAITGAMGSGKSTTLKSLIRFIPEDLALRIQEMAFELNLRYTYPNRDIVTFQETDSITGQEGLNLQKKTNGSVNIVGEVADATASSFVIQTSMVASLFTMFTHHAKTAYDLVISLRNDLLREGGYSNEKAAEEMVAKVINIDFHMEKLKGHRFCQRITEIIPIRDRRYPSDKDMEHKAAEELLPADTIEYQKRVTDRQVFTTVNLCEWKDGQYYMRHMPSDEMMFDIRSNLSAAEEELFLKDMEMLRSMIIPEGQETAANLEEPA
jgi:pilus assembly protein CpaF